MSEIKAELELRGVSYAGVFERNELEALLLDARTKGKARPEILEQVRLRWWYCDAWVVEWVGRCPSLILAGCGAFH